VEANITALLTRSRFLDVVTNKSADISYYLARRQLSAQRGDHCLRSEDYTSTYCFGQAPHLVYLDMMPLSSMPKGIGIWIGEATTQAGAGCCGASAGTS